MTADDAIAAASLMDRTRVVSPFAGLPTAASVGQFTDTRLDPDMQLADMYKLTGDDSFWGQDYDEDQTGYNYANRSTNAFDINTTVDRAQQMGLASTSRDPAAISVLPTSSKNPERPRTVAAGYDQDRGVLTVVFRDGTFYNYYNVGEDEWAEFKARQSKGEYIFEVLDGKPRGTARMANVALAAREGLYRIARTGQWLNDGQVSGQFDRSGARTNPTRQRRKRP